MTGKYVDYDTQAANYYAHRRIHPAVFQQLLEIISAFPNSKVLEVGCGTGNYATALQEQTGCQMSGIDPSAEMLSRAAEQGPTLRLQKASAQTFSFPDERFDLIYSVDVIHHVTDRQAYFRNAFDHLTEGGSLVTVTDSHNDILDRVPLTSYFPETLAVELERYPSLETLREELVATGFNNVHETAAIRQYGLTDIEPYRARSYSSLLLIPDDAWQRGLDNMERDLTSGPILATSPYTLLWGAKTA